MSIEFRAVEDEAWYSVSVELLDDGETLHILHQGEGFDYWKPKFFAGDFKSAAEVSNFAARFRPTSHQLQDDQCWRVTKGMTVCASLCQLNDLRFYDAVVEGVQHVDHAFNNGEEECLCSFLLCWQHGPSPGYITLVGVANICLIEPAAVINSSVNSFINLMKERIQAAGPKLGFEEHVEQLGFSERQDEDLLSNFFETIKDRSADIGADNNKSADDDIGADNDKRTEDDVGADNNIGAPDAGLSGPGYYILINNLDKNSSTSAISHFIAQHTLVSPRVFLYPSRLSVPFDSAAIATDSRENIEKIYDFLVNPKHLVVSSEDRPWVVYEKVFDESCAAIRLLSQSQAESGCQGKEEFHLVHSGTEAYHRALSVRDLYLQFLHYEERLYAKLAAKQEEILKAMWH